MVERLRMAMRMGGRCGSGIGRVVGVKEVALVREVARTGGCVECPASIGKRQLWSDIDLGACHRAGCRKGGTCVEICRTRDTCTVMRK